MKFIDTFNEDDKKKLTKKAKLIYSVLKKGTITRSDGVKFSYELGDNMVPSVVDGEIELFVFITKIIERTYCPINEIAMSDLIMKKFEQFDIKVDLQIPKSIEIVKYKGKKPWELNEEDIDRDHLKKMKKKGELIYKLYKKGKLIADREEGVIKYTYELSDSKLINAVPGDIFLSPDNIKIKYYNDLTKQYGFLPILDSIKKRFHNHGITFNIPPWTNVYMDEWKEPKEPMNESEDKYEERREKMIKKGKAVYTALKSGKINYNPYGEDNEPARLTITLSDERDIFISPEGDIWITPKKIKVREENKECMAMSSRKVEDLIKEKFEMYNIRLSLRNFNPREDWDTWLDRERPLNENHEEYKEKQIKKGKTIYKALKKGTIGGDDPEQPHFNYELPDDFSVDTNNVGIIISLNKIKIKQLNRKCNIVSNADFMGFLIRKRFSHFGIVLTSSYGDRYFEYDIEPWERPTINEELNNITEKDRKKIELIYGLFKRGKYTVEDILYNYVLPDEYWIYDRNETGELIVVLTMDPTQKMKLYAKIKKEDGNLYHREVPVQATQYASLYDDAKKRIKEKFERFNIEIVF